MLATRGKKEEKKRYAYPCNGQVGVGQLPHHATGERSDRLLGRVGIEYEFGSLAGGGIKGRVRGARPRLGDGRNLGKGPGLERGGHGVDDGAGESRDSEERELGAHFD